MLDAVIDAVVEPVVEPVVEAVIEAVIDVTEAGPAGALRSGLWSGLWSGLLHDASARSAAAAALTDLVHDHRAARGSWCGDLIGPLVVTDRELTGCARALNNPTGSAPAADPLAIVAVNTTGAGGLLALGERGIGSGRLSGLDLIGVESALRDLDDLATNAARVATAAESLAESVSVYVEIPFGHGWQQAIDEVEAAGLHAAVRVDDDPSVGTADAARRLSAQISALVEADLAFKIIGTPPERLGGLVGVLMAIDALIEEPDPEAAADWLRAADPQLSAEAGVRIRSMDAAAQGRLRRRLLAVDSGDPRACAEALVGLELVPGLRPT